MTIGEKDWGDYSLSLKVFFNNDELTNFFIVTSGLVRPIGATRSNESVKIGNSNFRRYKGYTMDQKVISVPFAIIGNTTEKKRELAKALNVPEPAPLKFSDDPNVYYMAVPADYAKLEETIETGIGTITFEIPDGVAYSAIEKEYIGVNNLVNIDNQGTEKSYPIAEIKMRSDNGYVGLISDKGEIVQVGSVEEVDGVDYERSEMLINDTMSANATGWQDNKATLVIGLNSAIDQNGTFKYSSVNGDPIVLIDSYGSGIKYHGASKTKQIPPDSEGIVGAKNFTYSFKNLFMTNAYRNVGNAQFTVTDTEKRPLATIEFQKTNDVNNTAMAIFYIRGHVVDIKYFQANQTNNIAGSKNAISVIRKFGGKFEFHVGERIYTYNDDTAADYAAKEVSFFLGKYGTKDEVAGNYVHKIQFNKHNVDKWEDVPNTFAEGDVLRVDFRQGKIYLNDTDRKDLSILGNKFFALEPKKENKVYLSYSSWAQEPEFKMYNREVFL